MNENLLLTVETEADGVQIKEFLPWLVRWVQEICVLLWLL